MKLSGFRPFRGKLKAYLIRKPEEIQNNQSGEVRVNCYLFCAHCNTILPFGKHLGSIFHHSNKSASPENPR
jgi:hypothetical protein